MRMRMPVRIAFKPWTWTLRDLKVKAFKKMPMDDGSNLTFNDYLSTNVLRMKMRSTLLVMAMPLDHMDKIVHDNATYTVPDECEAKT